MFFKNFRAFRVLDAFRVSREGRGGISEPRDFAALALRISGESVFHSGGESYTASAGSIIYIPSGVGFTRVGKEEELIILHLECPIGEGDKIELTYPKNTAEAAELMNAIYEEWKTKKDGFEYRAAALLYKLIATLASPTENGSNPYRRSIIEHGAELISLNFSDRDLSVSRLAAACNMSAEYFRRLYKAEYGLSPYTAILDRRIAKAKGLLESGYFTVQQVADESGFSNVKHFSTLFRKRTGKSPSEYRKLFN